MRECADVCATGDIEQTSAAAALDADAADLEEADAHAAVAESGGDAVRCCCCCCVTG
jgi:hypothetical protein